MAGYLIILGLVVDDEEVDSLFPAFQQGRLDNSFVLLSQGQFRDIEQGIEVIDQLLLQLCVMLVMLCEDPRDVDMGEVVD